MGSLRLKQFYWSWKERDRGGGDTGKERRKPNGGKRGRRVGSVRFPIKMSSQKTAESGSDDDKKLSRLLPLLRRGGEEERKGKKEIRRNNWRARNDGKEAQGPRTCPNRGSNLTKQKRIGGGKAPQKRQAEEDLGKKTMWRLRGLGSDGETLVSDERKRSKGKDQERKLRRQWGSVFTRVEI